MTMINPANKIIWRNLQGVLLLNKDLGSSSNRALQQVRKLYRAAKAGHTGSLDPLATGVLPVCFGDATKFSSYLLDSDKEYLVTAKLGAITSTGDLEGEIIASAAVPQLSAAHLAAVVNSFVGASQQIPSMYSALKHNGQPLYKLARQGINIERAPRDIFIYELNIVAFANDLLTLKVKCSKGTYIRNLVEDIGAKFGCGAHVVQLQRTAAGAFTLENTISFAQLQQLNEQQLDALILPTVSLLQGMPQLELTDNDANYVCNGRIIASPGSLTPGDFCLLNMSQKFLGIGTAYQDGTLKPKRMCAAL